MNPETEQYLGPIRTRAQAMRIARRLEAAPEAINLAQRRRAHDAAKILRRNWRSVAARPAVARDARDLADTVDPRKEPRSAAEQKRLQRQGEADRAAAEAAIREDSLQDLMDPNW